MEIFVARQPIFDASRDVIAYELLFRDGLANAFSGIDGTEATRQVMLNTFVLFGLHRLTAGRPAFVNFTRDALLSDMVTLFPMHSMVIEILESVTEDNEVLEQCRRLRDAGYAIALDDFTQVEGHEALLEFADIVKVDFRLVAPNERRALARYFRGKKIRLLGEKVETYDDFREAQDAGYALFQGYFFAKPEIMNRNDVPGLRVHHLRLLRELRRPGVSVERYRGHHQAGSRVVLPPDALYQFVAVRVAFGDPIRKARVALARGTGRAALGNPSGIVFARS